MILGKATENDQLLKSIGQLNVGHDFLDVGVDRIKERLVVKPLKERRSMISKGQLSMTKQCKLFSMHRSGLYYLPKGESRLNLELMRLMDEHYLHHPFKGANRMHTWLTMDKGYKVSKNRKKGYITK